MHILAINFGTGEHGADRAFVTYCEILKNSGYRLSTIIHPNFSMLNHLVRSLIKVRTKNISSLFDIFSILKLKKEIYKINPDIIIASGNIASQIIIRFLKDIPRIIIPNGYHVKKMVGDHGIIVVNHKMYIHYLHQGQERDKLYYINHLADLYRADVSNDPQSIIKNRDYKYHNPPVIGVMGKFSEKKAFDIFIRALAILKKNNHPFRGVIAGKGEEEFKLKYMVKIFGLENKIDFVGWVDKDEFFAECDIFCVPSFDESFSRTVVDSMSRSVPVIASDTYGISDIIDHDETGLLFKFGDIDALAKSLLTLLLYEDKAKILANNALKSIEKLQEAPSVVETLCQVIEQFAKNNKTHRSNEIKSSISNEVIKSEKVKEDA